MVIHPVAVSGALDTRALCRLAFVVSGAIVITIAVDVSMLLLAIVERAASDVTRGNLAPCPVGVMLILTSTNLIAKLVLEFELRCFLLRSSSMHLSVPSFLLL